MNQSQFPAITCNSLKARGKSCVQGAIGIASHWLKNWREILKPITQHSKRNCEAFFFSTVNWKLLCYAELAKKYLFPANQRQNKGFVTPLSFLAFSATCLYWPKLFREKTDVQRHILAKKSFPDSTNTSSLRFQPPERFCRFLITQANRVHQSSVLETLYPYIMFHLCCR